jgi:hypothetical protein
MSDLDNEMKANALEAQKFSRKHLVVELDFSPESLLELDPQCDAVEYAIRGGKSAENIAMLTRIWGAYLGETIRLRIGGQWEEEPTGPVLSLGSERLRPHERVRLRLVEGASHSLVAYFAEIQSRAPHA